MVFGVIFFINICLSNLEISLISCNLIKILGLKDSNKYSIISYSF